jgi:hypothetical protein
MVVGDPKGGAPIRRRRPEGVPLEAQVLVARLHADVPQEPLSIADVGSASSDRTASYSPRMASG